MKKAIKKKRYFCACLSMKGIVLVRSLRNNRLESFCMDVVIYVMDKKKIAASHKAYGGEIISKMIKILMVAQRKVDDKKYRETIEKFNPR